MADPLQNMFNAIVEMKKMRRLTNCPVLVNKSGDPVDETRLAYPDSLDRAELSTIDPHSYRYQKNYLQFCLADVAKLQEYLNQHEHHYDEDGRPVPTAMPPAIKQLYFECCKGCGLAFSSTPDLPIAILPCCLRYWHRNCLKFTRAKLRSLVVNKVKDPLTQGMHLHQIETQCIRTPKCIESWPAAFMQQVDQRGIRAKPDHPAWQSWKSRIMLGRWDAGLPPITDKNWNEGPFMVPPGVWRCFISKEEPAWIKRQRLIEARQAKPPGFW